MRRDASLGRRLLIAASAFIAIALVVAAIAIGFVFHRFIQRQVDERLDTQIAFLLSTVKSSAEGMLALDGEANGPPFDRPGRGWYWQVRGPRNVLHSRSLGGGDLDLESLSVPSLPPPPPEGGPRPPRPADGMGPDGQFLHYRLQRVLLAGVPIEIVATAPRSAVLGPLREAMVPLGVSLMVLCIALVLAMVFQIRLGLRPLERLRGAVADVRAGRRETLPEEQPEEVRPLVSELNALLKQNAANLERARMHLANLAHGLKTPLATLSLALSGKEQGNRELADLVDIMERRIRHHLRRARSAALAGPVRAQTPVAPELEALGGVLSRVHADRGLKLTLDVPADLSVACEAQDFDEIAGNLLDNAFKWASHSVRVTAVAVDRDVVLTIDDDGPGLSAEQIPHVLQAGKRLDESAPGFGFGLSITRELVELYGGALVLGAAPTQGLRVVLRLPLAHQSE